MNMKTLQIEIIKRLLMVSTHKELQKINECVMNSITTECDEDDKAQEEFKKWKKESEDKNE